MPFQRNTIKVAYLFLLTRFDACDELLYDELRGEGDCCGRGVVGAPVRWIAKEATEVQPPS